MFLVADSVLLLVFGRRWVRFTRFGHPGGDYYQLMTWFLTWPEWALRAVGAAEGLLGLSLLQKWQPPPSHGNQS
jgi:hypothetical protein